MLNDNNHVEIFNNYESEVVGTPLQIMACDSTKLVNDFYTHYGIDAADKDSSNYRYVLARLFWFIMIHYSDEKTYPKLYKFFSKITNEVIVVNIRSYTDEDYEYRRDKKKNIENPNEWYGLLRNKLLLNDVELPESVHDMATSIDIYYHLNNLESQLSDGFVNDPNIRVTLRGLYNVYSSYLAIGLIVPFTHDYINYMDGILRDEYKDSLTCYVQYSDKILNDYINPNPAIVVMGKKYKFNYPVSVQYKNLNDPSLQGLTEIYFTTKTPYKKFHAIEADEYEVTDIAFNIYAKSNGTISDVFDNEDKCSYSVSIKTKSPDSILNFLKIKDILPDEVHITPIDPLSEQFYRIVDRLHTYKER